MSFGFDIIVRNVLLPVLAVQGLILRARALNLPEAAGPRKGSIGSGPPLRVLIIGDSSAAGVGVATQSQALAGHLTRDLAKTYSVTWTVFAKTGATTASTLKRLHQLPLRDYDVAVMALGVNDVTRGTRARKWLRLQDALGDRLRRDYGARHILHSALPPMEKFPLLPNPLAWILGCHARRLDAAQQQRCATARHLHHVPFDMDLNPDHMATDGFHPGPEVYEAWGHEMARVIRRRLGNLPDAPA